MGKTTISVVCADQRLVTVVTPIVASGGQNEDVVRFEFCPLWEGFAKTAVFYRDDSEQYIVALDGDQCVIPSEVLQTEGIVYFGVFGVKDGITRTSEVIQYRVVKGAVTEGTRPADPTPDIYTQIMNHLAAVESRMAPLGAFEQSGNVVQFDNYAGMPVLCVTDITLSQSGSGSPARDNIRAITGWSGAKLTRCRSMEESTAPDAEEFVVEFGQNVYSGSLNWNTGVLTIDKGYVEFRGADGEAWGLGSSPSTFYIDVHGMAKLSDYRASLLSNIYPNVRNQHEFTTSSDAAGLTGYADTAGNYPGQNWIYIRDYAAATVEEFKALLAETPVQVVYPLESPITVGFTPAHITALHGTNTIWCDAGPTTVSGRLDLLWPTELLAQRDTGGSSAQGKADAFVVGEGLQMNGDVLEVVPECFEELANTKLKEPVSLIEIPTNGKTMCSVYLEIPPVDTEVNPVISIGGSIAFNAKTSKTDSTYCVADVLFFANSYAKLLLGSSNSKYTQSSTQQWWWACTNSSKISLHLNPGSLPAGTIVIAYGRK